ncbi:hypothetical protein IGI04_030336 [Brassica rapa subsp. trilocularis]|uniref:Uncharacterized protein n=1 Tax=Brassica rapa subsp. trilocularis TaxID=1813537 RepID=A0ABQ7LT52_BRACM|nr:hypothetical protein IGI04_030336 [Brassica rapa subsp. trilocularis]
MAKQQLHFFELRAGRSRNVKKGGDLMGMDLILLDGKGFLRRLWSLLIQPHQHGGGGN